MRNRDEERKYGKNMHIGVSIFALVILAFWCVMAIASGAGFMAIFGIGMAGLIGYRLYAALKLSKSREKEPESWDQPDMSHRESPYRDTTAATGSNFCPYCGAGVEGSFSFCPKCGRKLQ